MCTSLSIPGDIVCCSRSTRLAWRQQIRRRILRGILSRPRPISLAERRGRPKTSFLKIFLNYKCDYLMMIQKQPCRECYRRKLLVLYTDNTKQTIMRGIRSMWSPDGRTSDVLTVERCKLSWSDHVCRHYTLPKITQQGTIEGGRHKGRPPQKSLKDNIKE